MVTDPIQPVAAMIGNGVLMVKWGRPISYDIKHYEIVSSLNEAGPYVPLNQYKFPTEVALIRGIPPTSQNIYLKVRAIDPSGDASNYVKVKRGVLSKPTITMSCFAIEGSVIPEGSRFAALVNGRVITVEATEEINFTV